MEPPRIRRGVRPHLYIDEWMEVRGLSLDDMAGRIELDGRSIARNTVWRWKNEQHRLNPDKIALIAAALDLEPEDLWRPPGRRSIDAMLANEPDELYEMSADVVSRLIKRVS